MPVCRESPCQGQHKIILFVGESLFASTLSDFLLPFNEPRDERIGLIINPQFVSCLCAIPNDFSEALSCRSPCARYWMPRIIISQPVYEVVHLVTGWKHCR